MPWTIDVKKKVKNAADEVIGGVDENDRKRLPGHAVEALHPELRLRYQQARFVVCKGHDHVRWDGAVVVEFPDLQGVTREVESDIRWVLEQVDVYWLGSCIGPVCCPYTKQNSGTLAHHRPNQWAGPPVACHRGCGCSA